MPSDRHEALHLILGFCKDHGLLETYRSLCWEAGLDATSEQLAEHVSLLRILLDWKRAFEARFNGTPRIIVPTVSKDEDAPVTLAHLSQQAPTVILSDSQHQAALGTASLAGAAPQQQHYASLPTASSQELANGSVQTMAYLAPPNAAAGIFRPPAGLQIMGGQGGAAPQFVLAPQAVGALRQGSQALMGGEDDQGGPQGVMQAGGGGLLGPQHSALQQQHSLQQQPSLQGRHQLHHEGGMQLAGLPPRPPGASHPSHSSSLYSPPDGPNTMQQQHPEGSQDGSPDEWHGGHDGDEMGDTSAGAGGGSRQQQQWASNGGSMAALAGGMIVNGHAPGGGGAAGRRASSSAGTAPPVTKLRNGADPITQETFLAVITQVGHGAVATQLFDFRRPQRGSSSSARRSAILQLTDAQHDAMYALAGCEDVNFLISNVQSEVRLAMHQVFDIDKESFTVWFKNRGRNPSKTQQHHGAVGHHHGTKSAVAAAAAAYLGGGSNGGSKRQRMSEPGTASPE